MNISTLGQEYAMGRAEIVTQAEQSLLKRQKLPPNFSSFAVRPSYDGLGLAIACFRPQAFFMPATSIFPSATVTALTSAATAYAPAQHGLVGTTVFMPEMGGVVSLIWWRPIVAPTNYIGYHTPADGFTQLRDRLQTRNNGKSFTSMYVPNVDTAAHRYGPLSTYYRAEVAALDFSLKRELLEPLTGRNDIVLLIVADHGQLHVHPDRILWLNQHPTLTKLLIRP